MAVHVRCNFWYIPLRFSAKQRREKKGRSQTCTLRPRLHGSGQIFAWTKTCTVPPCVYMGPAELDGFLCVQVWDLKKVGPKLAHLAVQKSVQYRRSRVNARWNPASFCPLPPFSLIRDFGKQNTRGNVSKISVSLTCY